MIAILVEDCQPTQGDFLLLPTATYQVWDDWQVWVAALRWLWEQWCAAFALFVAGMALATKLGRSEVYEAIELGRAA